jgi:CDP-diacylglycerol---serine O-phosphatidyltransferase
MLHDAVEQLEAKDFLTLANGASGFLSVYYALSSNPGAAMVFVIIAAAFDYLDGKVARETKKANDFGRELDSLSDIISFGVAPAAIVAGSYYQQAGIIFALIYVCAGLVRLAAYNLQKEKGHYIGLPIPAAAFIVIATYFLVKPLAPYALLLCAVLMVLKVTIRKPNF